MIKRIFDRAVLGIVNFVITVLITVDCFFGRKRMSHNNGIVAKGKLTIVENPDFPEHDFFEAGKEFACRVRFATVRLYDDAAIAVRAASIKFADTDYKSPLDIEMNTGVNTIFWNVYIFIQFMIVTIKGTGKHLIPYYERLPTAREASISGARRAPDSFLQLYFYSQIPVHYTGRDGVERYVKFRLIPEDRGAESGLPTEKDIEIIWKQDPLTEENRSRNYLKNELAERTRNKRAKMILQLQLHTWNEETDDQEIFNSNVAWPEESHPWIDLAKLELEETLPYEEGTKIIFSIAQHPPSLNLIKAKSIYDYNSINLLRVKTYWAKRSRLLSYRFFGMPDPIPDER